MSLTILHSYFDFIIPWQKRRSHMKGNFTGTVLLKTKSSFDIVRFTKSVIETTEYDVQIVMFTVL